MRGQFGLAALFLLLEGVESEASGRYIGEG